MSYEWRRRIRTGFRIIWVLWAGVWLPAGIAVTLENLDTESVGGTIATIVLTLVLSVGPLVCHLWWSRQHPISPNADEAAAIAIRPGATLHAKLDRIRELSEQLRQRDWSTPNDRRAVADRVDRLRELVDTDEASVARGGVRSTVLEPEIDRLLMQVGGILDAAINSATVAPGDGDLDRRLQDQLEAHQARQRAINELEGRTQPGQ